MQIFRNFDWLVMLHISLKDVIFYLYLCLFDVFSFSSTLQPEFLIWILLRTLEIPPTTPPLSVKYIFPRFLGSVGPRLQDKRVAGKQEF